jgi:hypothetical protein
MSKQTPVSLDQRVATALADAKTTSAEVMEMMADTEAALTAAEAKAEAERAKALDPIASPDAAEAERSAWAAELARDRLRSSLSRLRQRFEEVAAVERDTQWQATYEEVEAKCNALAKEFSEKYQKLTNELCDLFGRMKAVDEECSRVNGEAVTGEHRRLFGVELTARDLRNFSISDPSIMETVRLPDWKKSDRTAWPPPRTPLAALVAAAMTPPHDLRYTGDWAAAREQDRARRAAAAARRAEEEAARQVASRQAYEASLRR